MFRKLAVLVTLVCLLINLPPRRVTAMQDAPYNRIRRSAFSSDGRFGVFVWHNDQMCLVDMMTGSAVMSFTAVNAEAWLEPLISPDGKYVAILEEGRHRGYWKARIWDRASGQLVSELNNDQIYIESTTLRTFSPDGRLLLINTVDGAYIFDVVLGKLKHYFEYEGSEYFNTAQLSTDNKYLLTVVMDMPELKNNAAVLWDVETGKLIHAFVHGLHGAMSADTRRISIVTRESELFIYDLKTLRQVYHLRDFAFVDFSPDGRFILDDDFLDQIPNHIGRNIFDVYQLKRIFPATRLFDIQQSEKFSADSKSYILIRRFSDGYFNQVVFWDVLDQKEIGRFTPRGDSELLFYPYDKIYAVDSTWEGCIQLHNTKRDLVEKVYCPLGDNRNPAN